MCDSNPSVHELASEAEAEQGSSSRVVLVSIVRRVPPVSWGNRTHSPFSLSFQKKQQLKKKKKKKNLHYQLVTILGAEISIQSHSLSNSVLLFPIALYTQNGGFCAINASLHHRQLLTHRSPRIRASDENEKRGLIL